MTIRIRVRHLVLFGAGDGRLRGLGPPAPTTLLRSATVSEAPNAIVRFFDPVLSPA